VKRTVRFDPPGIAALLFAAGLLVAGSTSGINYLVFIALSLASALLLSAAAALRRLRAVSLALDVPAAAVRGTPFVVSIRASNASARFFPGGTVAVHFGDPADTLVVTLPPVPGRGERRLHARHGIGGRGRFDPLTLALATVRPFGLLRATRVTREAGGITVYPRAPACRLRWNRDAFRENSTGLDAAGPAKPGQTGLFRGLRGYAPGDPLRAIHWPKTAQRGELMSKEFETARSSFVAFVLLETRAACWPDRAAFEAAVDAAAGLVRRLITEEGIPVSVLASTGPSLAYEPGTDLSQNLASAMRFLAEVRLQDRPEAPPPWSALPEPPEACFCVGPGGPEAARAFDVMSGPCRHAYRVPVTVGHGVPILDRAGAEIGAIGEGRDAA
jgi:uncharacterized protein (DUF58 family)